MNKLYYSQECTFLTFWEESRSAKSFDAVKSYPHYKLYQSVIKKLKSLGFRVTKNPRIEKEYKVLSPYHRYGKWRELEVDIEIYPAGFKLDFYQNVNTGDRKKGDGRYNTQPWKLMPYLTKKRYDYVVRALVKFISGQTEVQVENRDTPVLAEEAIIRAFESRFTPKKQIKSLADIETFMTDYDHRQNSLDRDKKVIKCGEVKYFRSWYSGQLLRGVVYHNINNMWWVIVNKFHRTNMASFELFDATPEDFKRPRLAHDRRPQPK